MLKLIRQKLLILYGFPYILLYIPYSYLNIIKIFFKKWIFLSKFEIYTRCYYETISKYISYYGRNGYSFEEALGTPLYYRIYNNYFTYLIYKILSPKQFSILCYFLFIMIYVIIGLILENYIFTFLSLFILITSPFIIQNTFSYLIKPEVIIWPIAIISYFFATQDLWSHAILIYSIILIINFSVSVLIGIVTFPLWIFSYIETSSLPGNYIYYLFLLPGIMKNVYKLYILINSKFINRLTKLQSSKKKTYYISIKNIIDSNVEFIFPLFLVTFQNPYYFMITLCSFIFVIFVNTFIFKITDKVSIKLLQLCLILPWILFSNNYFGFISLFLFLYYRPFQNISHFKEYESLNSYLLENKTFLKYLFQKYPWVSPIYENNFKDLNKIKNLIPKHSRVVFESFNSLHLGESETVLRNYLASYCHESKIEFINQYFILKMTEPQLSNMFLNDFNFDKLSEKKIIDITKKLGITHVICFSKIMKKKLKKHRKIFSLNKKNNSELFSLFNLHYDSISLFEIKNTSPKVTPRADLSLSKNKIIIKAKQNQTYYIKYRFDKKFTASQNNLNISVDSYYPFKNLPLKFLKVKSLQNSDLIIKFNS